MSRIILANSHSIKEAADKICGGDIVVLPTETVYGLGADATNEEAVKKIFKAKNRPAKNPLIIHIENIETAQKYGVFSKQAKILADAFWPGALTLILNQTKENDICDLVTAGLSTIAIRCPSHPVMRHVIKQSKCPIAAPSANNSGEPSATTPQHAAQSLGDNIDMILAAGACEVGLESTVIDLTDDVPIILRPGSITLSDIQEYLPDTIMNEGANTKLSESSKSSKSPGQMFKHYAPSIPVRLNAIDVEEGEALIAFGSIKFMGIKSGGNVKDLPDYAFRNLSEKGDLDEAAHNLFLMLRDLDIPKNKSIAVMSIPHTDIGVAINERLSRAAKG